MINKLLEKLNIKNVLDLNTEEKKTLSNWQEVFNKGEITIKELKEYLESQISIITDQLLVYRNSKEKDNYLKARLLNYRMILTFLESPEKKREYLNKYIDNLK